MIDLTENAPGKIMGCASVGLITVIVLIGIAIALVVKYLF